jgi:glycosyltransferase involved in cell wall biosynthesis
MIAYTDYTIDARVRREAETLAAAGFRVLCLTTTNGTEPARFFLEGVEIRQLAVPKYRGKSTAAYLGSYLRFLLASSATCVRLLTKGELDVVHVHNIPDFLVLAGVIPRLAGCRVVLDVHDSVPETFATKFSGKPGFWKALCLEEKLSALLAHKVICVNQPQRETLIGRGIPLSKTFVSMNVPDPRIFARPSEERATAGTGSFDLVYHGTMASRLGVDLIIRAVARLEERVPELRLHLWGHGDDLAGFQALAGELGVSERVVFRPKGFPLHDLPSHLASMDLGVVGNRRNMATDLMLPVKLMEYVSLGIPAVVPRLKTIQHYFSDDMVAYYEPEDVESLADAIWRLYRAPEMRRQQVDAAGAFLRDYGWERRGGELVSFYRRLLENPS